MATVAARGVLIPTILRPTQQSLTLPVSTSYDVDVGIGLTGGVRDVRGVNVQNKTCEIFFQVTM